MQKCERTIPLTHNKNLVRDISRANIVSRITPPESPVFKYSLMMQEFSQILSSQYSPSVHEAVRYGYLYRKKSETLGDSLHFCIPEASTVLLWIASSVASGVVYDIIKEKVKHLASHLRKCNKKVDHKTETILNDETALKEFTIYIEEYYSHRMNISEGQEKYIKEEVIADTTAKEVGKIYEETGRFVLTKEEYLIIARKAVIRAEELIHRKNPQ